MSAQTDNLQSTAPLHRGWESDSNLHEIQAREGKSIKLQLSGCTGLHPATCSPTCSVCPPLVTAMAVLHCGAGDPKQFCKVGLVTIL